MCFPMTHPLIQPIIKPFKKSVDATGHFTPPTGHLSCSYYRHFQVMHEQAPDGYVPGWKCMCEERKIVSVNIFPVI